MGRVLEEPDQPLLGWKNWGFDKFACPYPEEKTTCWPGWPFLMSFTGFFLWHHLWLSSSTTFKDFKLTGAPGGKVFPFNKVLYHIREHIVFYFLVSFYFKVFLVICSSKPWTEIAKELLYILFNLLF